MNSELVIPCLDGRTDSLLVSGQAGTWGSILPAAWCFLIAARARGLSTVWTILHPRYEQAAAAILGITYAQMMQAAFVPVARRLGTNFRPDARESLEKVVHWDRW